MAATVAGAVRHLLQRPARQELRMGRAYYICLLVVASSLRALPGLAFPRIPHLPPAKAAPIVPSPVCFRTALRLSDSRAPDSLPCLHPAHQRACTQRMAIRHLRRACVQHRCRARCCMVVSSLYLLFRPCVPSTLTFVRRTSRRKGSLFFFSFLAERICCRPPSPRRYIKRHKIDECRSSALYTPPGSLPRCVE